MKKRYINPIDLKRDLLVANLLGQDKTLGKIIDDVPSADVRENIHAKWERAENHMFYWYECSHCKHKPLRNEYEEEVYSSYCPYCGAIMDLE